MTKLACTRWREMAVGIQLIDHQCVADTTILLIDLLIQLLRQLIYHIRSCNCFLCQPQAHRNWLIVFDEQECTKIKAIKWSSRQHMGFLFLDYWNLRYIFFPFGLATLWIIYVFSTMMRKFVIIFSAPSTTPSTNSEMEPCRYRWLWIWEIEMLYPISRTTCNS